jgi:phosphohistidine phosphatase
MKNLILVRHAKSSWDAPLKDIDRPLTTRGIIDAHFVAEKTLQYLPKTFVIWSSNAKRATETAIIFTQTFSCPLDSIIFKADLYSFEASRLEKIIKNCNALYDAVVLFGHNDAITDFVNKFGDKPIGNVPTSGMVSIEFEGNSWANIKNGKILKTIFPKDFK